ncbi:uncharacterized protein MYCFIDRAFT_213981 [Pseudocercospora fijiensis CIRAD86]|uniref:F-box domain-containing protein n=1 Tax=Pseudocercospora fijiensis (strain CIRAD86) TaxID=383855 RepID=M3AMG8_PSEFD|nr:uncharacterized protein MYCFIDRAFT_213981 [Pseudocercospora fijiensis CIRAD86]EME85756.1 hypothetical protein MYCFIDRAFT_213981 [Pseudocercospora fijiensis CIRAD86]
MLGRRVFMRHYGHEPGEVATLDAPIRSKSTRTAPTRQNPGASYIDALHLRLPVELWNSVFSSLPAEEIRELRTQSFGLRDLIDANQEAIVRGITETALTRLVRETEEANSLSPGFVRALRKWLDRNGICEKCYSAAHYDDLAAFIWHWSRRISPILTTEQQPSREDFEIMNTACRYIIALESMPLQCDLARRVQSTRQYVNQLQRILSQRQDLFAFKGKDEIYSLLDRLEYQPQPYPYDLLCGGNHITPPMTNSELLENHSGHEDETPEVISLVPLRNNAKVVEFECDIDRDEALQRLHLALGIPRLVESAPGTYYSRRTARWVMKMVRRITSGEALEFDSLDKACMLEAIKVI